MVRVMVDSVRKIEDSFEKAPANLKKYLVTRILNASKSLEGGDVEMNLVQMRHAGSLKAYVIKFNNKMNGTTKIDEF